MEAALPEGEVCANIGPRERRLRNQVGVAGAMLTLLTVAALIEVHAPFYARFLVIIPAYIAAMGFAQARAQTCVAFAKKGIRVLGDSRKDAEKVVEDSITRRIAAQARTVWVQASAVVAALTLLVMAIP